MPGRQADDDTQRPSIVGKRRSVRKDAGMLVKRTVAVLVALLATCLSGCALRDTFNCLDRYCFLADWTNHYSCTSCCGRGDCDCQQPLAPVQ